MLGLTPLFRATRPPQRGGIAETTKALLANDSSQPGLRIFYSTVIKKVTTRSRQITALEAISRTPCTDDELRKRGITGIRCTGDGSGYDKFLSQDLTDWYSPKHSPRFLKTRRIFRGKNGKSPIVIEASAFGDVLALSQASYLQGMEARLDKPETGSPHEQCGMAMVFPFVMEYSATPATEPGNPFGQVNSNYSLTTFSTTHTWESVWTYRRIRSKASDIKAVAIGDLSMQNWNPGNDYFDGYVFKSRAQTRLETLDWHGGVNLKSLAGAERQAMGWYDWLKRTIQEKAPETAGRILLNRTVLGTAHGLSRMPYLRETRRSIGIGNFALTLADVSCYSPERLAQLYELPVDKRNAIFAEDTRNGTCRTSGTPFSDAVGIGSYVVDLRLVTGCSRPSYISGVPAQTAPFLIPFRALTNRDFDNLLVAGKSMAQTFLANGATRVQPVEWHSGIAAGTAAAEMHKNAWSATDAYGHIHELQAVLKSVQPIAWTLP